MSVLLRKSLRDLRALRWQAVGIALLTAIVTMLFVGGSRTRNMLAASVDHWANTLALHDLEVMVAPSPPGLSAEVRDTPGVADAEERLVVRGFLTSKGVARTPALIRVMEPTPPRMNRLRLIAGRLPEAGEAAALVDRALPRDLGVGIGATIELAVGPQRLTVPVVGSVLSPEHMLFPVHPGHTIPLRGSVAVVYLTRAALRDVPMSDRVTSLTVRFTSDTRRDEAQQRVLAAIPDAPLRVRTRTQIPSIAFTSMIVRTFDVYLPLIAGLLALIALCLLALTHAQLAHRQTASIGTLASLGHPPRSMLLAGSAFVVVPVLAGALLGLAIERPFAHDLFRGYSESVGYAPMVDSGPGPVRTWTIVGIALSALVLGFAPLWWRARATPASLVAPGRRAARHGVLVSLAARLREVLRIPLSVTLGLTTVARKRFTTLAAIFGLGGILAVVMAFLLVHVAHKNAVDEAVDRMGLDATVFFDGAKDLDRLAPLATATEGEAEPFLSRFLGIRTAKAQGIRRFVAAPPGAWRDRLNIAEGRTLGETPGEVLIDRWIAYTHGVEVGDTIHARPHPNWPESSPLKVVGVLEGLGLGSLIADLRTGQDLFQLGARADGAYIASALPTAKLEATLSSSADVASVITTAGARRSAQANFRGTEKVLLTSLLFAIAVAVLYLAVLAALDARDRGKDLAVLQALGWRRRTVWSLCLTEVLSRGVLAVGLALLTARPLAELLVRRLEAVNHYRLSLPEDNTISLVLGLGVLLCLPLSALPAIRVSGRLTPARALRALTRE